MDPMGYGWFLFKALPFLKKDSSGSSRWFSGVVCTLFSPASIQLPLRLPNWYHVETQAVPSTLKVFWQECLSKQIFHELWLLILHGNLKYQPMVNWWFGARWFGFLGSPKMKGVPRLDPKPPTESTNLPLVESTKWYNISLPFYTCVYYEFFVNFGGKTLPLLSFTISRVTSAEVEVTDSNEIICIWTNGWTEKKSFGPRKIDWRGGGGDAKNTTFFGGQPNRTPNEPTMNLRQRQAGNAHGSVHHSLPKNMHSYW